MSKRFGNFGEVLSELSGFGGNKWSAEKAKNERRTLEETLAVAGVAYSAISRTEGHEAGLLGVKEFLYGELETETAAGSRQESAQTVMDIVSDNPDEFVRLYQQLNSGH